MAYVAPTARVAGDAVTASDYNIFVNNDIAMRAAAANIQQTIITTSQQVTLTTAATPFAIPGVTVSITPTTNTSKVMLSGWITLSNLYYASATFKFFRNGSVISAFTNTEASPSNRQQSQFGINAGSSFYTDTSAWASQAFTIIDSPATTSATTYTIHVQTNSSSSPIFYLNRTTADSDVSGTCRHSSVIIAQEVVV